MDRGRFIRLSTQSKSIETVIKRIKSYTNKKNSGDLRLLSYLIESDLRRVISLINAIDEIQKKT